MPNKSFYYFYILFLILSVFVIYSTDQNQLFIQINHWLPQSQMTLFEKLTEIGNAYFTSILILITVFFLPTSSRKLYLLVATCTSALTIGCTYFIKINVGYPRPLSNNFISSLAHEPHIKLLNDSFPSGHTVSIFLFSTLFSLFILKNKANYNLAILIFAIFIGLTRILVSAHFFEDIVAGSIIGVGFPTAIYLLLKPKKT